MNAWVIALASELFHGEPAGSTVVPSTISDQGELSSIPSFIDDKLCDLRQVT